MGLEPTTFPVTGGRSSQLSYARNPLLWYFKKSFFANERIDKAELESNEINRKLIKKNEDDERRPIEKRGNNPSGVEKNGGRNDIIYLVERKKFPPSRMPTLRFMKLLVREPINAKTSLNIPAAPFSSTPTPVRIHLHIISKRGRGRAGASLYRKIASEASVRNRGCLKRRKTASAVFQVGCGGRIRTGDLRVMGPTSDRCSSPRYAHYTCKNHFGQFIIGILAGVAQW